MPRRRRNRSHNNTTISALNAPKESEETQPQISPPNTPPILSYAKLTPRAVSPSRRTESSVGLDLKTPVFVELNPMDIVKTSIEISVKIPEGHYARIAPCSNLTYRRNIHILAGVVDRDYEGEVFVVAINLGKKKVNLKRGVKIAQLILEKASIPILTKVPAPSELYEK